ncbi:hypothetical protein GMDG_05864 [Pseudogymnoascus destructans 20631-21]|uniref:Uncharacterized protein n=2 Tax=Pseudogymnoascus destructans TaxID=655981 RepID=L8FR36_PSED2|nr:hypothetical protein GMDG_05864 [Pseudogymnoascus destructans 20631-21]
MSSLNTLKTRELFSSPPSTLDPLASPLLLFRGSAFHTTAFPRSWSPSLTLPGVIDVDSDSDFQDSMSELDSDYDFSDSPTSPNSPTSALPPSSPHPDPDTPIDLNPTRPQKRSYLKFPPAHSGLRLPMCNFQISHPLPSPPPSKSSKSASSKSAAVPHPDEPLEVVQAELMAAAVNRSVRMGYDTPLSRRGDEGGGGDKRAVVRELEGEGEVEERGAVGAREWLRDTMDWR